MDLSFKIVFVLFVFAYTAIFLPLPKTREYRALLKRRLVKVSQISLWTLFVFGLYCFLSSPMGFLQFLLVGNPKSDAERRLARKRIDAWILAWAIIVTPLCVFCLAPWVTVAFALIPLWRLFDIFQILLYLLLERNSRPQSVGRSASFLILHYIETITIFAGVYLLLQGISTSNMFFDRNGIALTLSPGMALYFSTITAATVGYGDVTPAATASKVVVGFELLCVLYIIAIALPHALSGFEKPPESKGA